LSSDSPTLCNLCVGTGQACVLTTTENEFVRIACPVCHPGREAARYEFLREVWPGMVAQVRLPRDDEPAGHLYTVRIGVSDPLPHVNDRASFDAAVDTARAQYREVSDERSSETEVVPGA